MVVSDSSERIHIVEVLEATGGGTRTHILHLLNGLDVGRFQLTLVASANRNPAFRKDMATLVERGVRVVVIPMVRRVAPLRDFLSLIRLVRVLKKLRPDVVHTHASKAGILGRIAASLCGIRAVIHTPHTYYFESKHGITRWFFRGLERLAFPLAAKTIVLCPGQRELAQRELGASAEGLALIENGIDVDHFSPRRDQHKARSHLGLLPDGPVVGTLTRFTAQKGCDLFLRAMAHVFEEFPTCRCVFVAGEGALRSETRALAEKLGITERIIWLEHASDPREVYEALDVFVMASRYEGLPYTLLEAMSMGLPVVAPNISGCVDVIKHDRTGLLAAPENPRELAECILRFLRGPIRAKEMGAEAQQHVADRYPLSRFIESTSRLYEDMAPAVERPTRRL